MKNTVISFCVKQCQIPYISEHMPQGRENTISQMRELIEQNYNHPCIVCWGVSNEITIVKLTFSVVKLRFSFLMQTFTE